MQTIASKIEQIRNAKDIQYTVGNDYLVKGKYRNRKWHLSAYDFTTTDPIWDSDKICDNVEDMITFLTNCEMDCISSAIDYLRDYCPEVEVDVSFAYAKEVVIKKIRIER